MGSPFVGEIRMGGWNFAPSSWAMCDGSLLSISQNDVLFNLIGTTYGGDGESTFALPNLLGRIPLHQGTDNFGNTYIMGQYSGVESVTVLTNQIPAHSHGLQASTAGATSNSPVGMNFAASAVDLYAPPSASVVTTTAATTLAGGSQPHDNLMPYMCITFVISLFGIYPSQD